MGLAIKNIQNIADLVATLSCENARVPETYYNYSVKEVLIALGLRKIHGEIWQGIYLWFLKFISKGRVFTKILAELYL